MLTLKNLDDYRVWPVKHRHWMFEVAEDEAHALWVRTRDVRAFWEKFPTDRELKSTHSSALLYASDSKQHYIAQRAMQQLLQRSKSHSFHPEVLKFLDWFERNVVRVAQSKRTDVRLADIQTHRAHHAQQVSLGPIRPHLASPQMEDTTLALSQEERWAMAQDNPAVPRVFHPEARILHMTWRQWLAEGPALLKGLLGAVWHGEANVWLTFALAAVVGALPTLLLAALVPQSPDDWPAAIVRLLWGHMAIAVLSVASAVAIVVMTTRCTRRSMGLVVGRWFALALYSTMLSFLPGIAVGSFDRDLFASWWATVRGEEGPAQVIADPLLGRIVLRGSMHFGSAEALQRAMERHPQLTLVELESPGGYVVEGLRMAQMLTRRGMDTVALGECASACTLLFAAGQARYLGQDAEMGFHRSGRRYGPVGEGWSATDHAMADYYTQRGVNRGFVEKALAPSSADLWVAPHAEQYASGFAGLRWSERKAGY